jgi:arylsulfatase A-like enzyme
MTNLSIHCFVIAAIALATTNSQAAELPNILWLTSEDHGPEMGCYGDKLARTPNIDALAAKGMLFRTAWSCVPVCAPARSAIISGMYPSSTGALHMRSMVPMPAGTQMYPQILREAGYYCTNNSKEDYNLAKPDRLWDESSPRAHWRNRPQGPAVLCDLQLDEEPREPDSHAAAHAGDRPEPHSRAGFIPIRRKFARTGLSTTTR